MNREAIGPIVLAAVCVLAVAFAAATISTPQQTGSGDLGAGADGEGGAGDDPGGSGIDLSGDDANESGMLEVQEGDTPVLLPSPCVTFLLRPEVVLGIVAAFLLFALVIKRRHDAVAAVGLTVTFGLPVFLVYILLSACHDRSMTQGFPEQLVGGGSGSDGSVGLGDPGVAVEPTAVPIVAYVVLGVALVAVLAFAFSSRGGFGSALDPIWSSSDDPEGEGEAPVGRASMLGELAGRAADRIEAESDADVENEVYRAWREMTRPLDVDRPRSSTPEEFASAATEAGVSREDVDELTELFEEVRYGGYDPDEDRERRAVDALRRIERQYGDGQEGEP